MKGLYLRGSVWWMSFTCKGRHYRRSTETEDPKLAKRIYDKVKGEIAEGKWFEKLPGEDKTFKELMELLINYSQKRCRSNTYVSSANVLNKFFGSYLLSEVTPRLWKQFKDEREVSGIKPGTVNRDLSAFKRAFNLACSEEYGWLNSNPVASIKQEKGVTKRDRWITQEEEEALLSHAPSWLQEIIIFGLNTGMRRGEILNLCWKAVDLFRRTITIMESKNNEKRTIPMNEKVYILLKEEAKVRLIGCDLVFHSPQSKSKIFSSALVRAFAKCVEKAGLEDLHFHDLRHTFGTRLSQKGEDVLTIKALLGHKTLIMTSRYVHHNVDSLRRAVEGLNDWRVTKMSQVKECKVTTFEN
jgi:integrase